MARKRILIIGAGRSSSALIQYLDGLAESNTWTIHVADRSLKTAQERCGSTEHCRAMEMDALDPDVRASILPEYDIVVSMLPARFHTEVVADCVNHGIHVITPSYVTEDIQALDAAAKEAGVIILNEMGLDPGIDHMSAMRIIHDIQGRGGELLSFKSFTGGLVAPESDNNPWHYKFTWNPRNVVLAGQGGAVQFIRNGKYKYIPYHRLFSRVEPIEIEGHGAFEGYANRDSLKYREVYGLKNIPTIYRGTLRKQGYSEAWNVFVQLGMTDDTYQVEDSERMTYRQFINSFLRYEDDIPVEDKLAEYLNLPRESEIFQKLDWLGIFEDKAIGIPMASPAQILQHLLESKWSLEPGDRDMIAMYHEFEYGLDGEEHIITSHMVSIGLDEELTGMARTVGLPIGIAVKHILSGNWKMSGVLLPTSAEIYDPILDELASMGIRFVERETVQNR
jgi:saccharopine dehydrogenase-like NADP-dependent oxidoreductase